MRIVSLVDGLFFVVLCHERRELLKRLVEMLRSREASAARRKLNLNSELRTGTARLWCRFPACMPAIALRHALPFIEIACAFLTEAKLRPKGKHNTAIGLQV
jgi:hypothetical protein